MVGHVVLALGASADDAGLESPRLLGLAELQQVGDRVQLVGELVRAALEAGAQEAERRGASLVVVNATRGDAYVDPRFASAEVVEQLRRRLGGGHDVEVLQDVVPDVGSELVRVADERGAELVVVGVRHRSPVGKALMGSVSQRVILDARCPVLAVKPPA